MTVFNKVSAKEEAEREKGKKQLEHAADLHLTVVIVMLRVSDTGTSDKSQTFSDCIEKEDPKQDAKMYMEAQDSRMMVEKGFTLPGFEMFCKAIEIRRHGAGMVLTGISQRSRIQSPQMTLTSMVH